MNVVILLLLRNASVISRTLCPHSRNDIITLQFTTHSKSVIDFTAEIYIAQVFYYNMSYPSPYEVLLMLNNNNRSPHCNLVAVHPATDCPFPFLQDMESHLKTRKPSDYETMLDKGVMLISRDQKPEYGYEGVNIYILGLDYEECSMQPKCDYSTVKTPEQDEITNPTAPTRVPDQVQPLGALNPRISLSAWQLSYSSPPKPTQTTDLLDSDSD